MALAAPSPIDVLNFQFKLRCKLKVFCNEDGDAFNSHTCSVASASRYGLVFVATSGNSFQVINTQNIESYSVKDGEVIDYVRREIVVASQPKHLSVNCDETRLSVVLERDSCAIAVIYEISSFFKQNVSTITEIRLSATPGVLISDTTWNPTMATVFTVCKSDGSLGLYDIKPTGIEITELPATAHATCMCWSPKGKQIAVGSHDGKITQYKPDLKAAKLVNAPPLEGAPSILCLQWVSNYQFIGIYKPQNPDSAAQLLVIDSPKVGATTYRNYEDVCYSYGKMRPSQFFILLQPLWNILMVASSNSMEVGVLGAEKEVWTQWILGDAARAELPLSATKQDTLPLGLALYLGATQPLIFGEQTLMPAPLLLLLSHHGVLCCFDVINLKSNAANLCSPPESVPDKSGQALFVKPGILAPPKPAGIRAPQVAADKVQQPQVLASNGSNAFSFSLGNGATNMEPAEVLFANTAVFNQSSTASLFSNAKPTASSSSLFSAPPTQPLFPSSPAIATPREVMQTKVDATNSASQIALGGKPSAVDGKSVQETEELIAVMVREECINLEADLKTLLHKGRLVKIDIGTDVEATEMVQGTNVLLDFLKELDDICAGQVSEVHCLKQNLVQTWAWYEETRSRLAICKDPAMQAVLRSQPLDPASARQLTDIKHIIYYIESQLTQANYALDEQWNNFQDSCKKTIKYKMPTMETIYQSMVRQNGILQKQAYILKDIAARLHGANRSKIGPSLLVSINSADDLEEGLKRLQLEPQDVFQIQYEKVLQRQAKLSASKSTTLKSLIRRRSINHVSVNKPQLQNSTLQISSFLAAPLSPIYPSKTALPKKLTIVQSTPKPNLTPQEASAGGFAAPKILFGAQTQQQATSGSEAAPLLFKAVATAPSSGKAGIAPSFSNATGSTLFTSVTATIAQASKPAVSTGASQVYKFPVATSTSTFSFQSTKQTAGDAMKPSTGFKFSMADNGNKEGKNESQSAALFSSAFAPTSQNVSVFAVKTTTAVDATVVKTATTAAPGSASSIFGKNSAFSLTKIPCSTGLSVTAVSSQESSGFTITPTSAVSKSYGIADAAYTHNIAAKAPVTITSAASSSNLNLETTTDTSSTTSAGNGLTVSMLLAPKATEASSLKTETSIPPAAAFGQAKVPIFTTTASFFGNTTITPQGSVPQKTELVQCGTTATKTGGNLHETTQNKDEDVPSFATSSSITQSKTESSPFGTLQTTKAETAVFGATQAKAVGSIFGAIPNKTSESAFLAPQTNVEGSFFGVPTKPVSSPFATTKLLAEEAPAFGTTQTNTTQSTPFASTLAKSSIFGSPPIMSQSSIFGSPPNSELPPTASVATAVKPQVSIFASVVTTSVVGAPISSSTVIPSQAPPFGGNATVFGNNVTSPSTQGSLFGSPAASTSSSVFGNFVAPQASVFGKPAAPSENVSVFAASAATTSQPGSIFGNTAAATSQQGSLFAAAVPAFGTPVSTTASFNAVTTTKSPFGTSTTGSVFASAPSSFGFGNGQSVFGGNNSFANNTPTTTGFGQTFTPKAAFGTAQAFAPAPVSSSVFGAPASTTTPFGSTANAFGKTSSSFSFSAAAANVPSTSAFGFAKPSTFGFGNNSVSDTGIGFGSLNVGNTTETAGSASFGSFGQAQNPFGRISTANEQKSPFSGGSLFGTPATTSSSVFGGTPFNKTTSGFASTPAFGTPTAFGQQQSTFGQSSTFGSGNVFGNPQSSAFSGGNQNVGQAGFGTPASFQKTAGFGSPPAFGGNPAGFGSPPSFGAAPAFGSSPTFGGANKVFGGGAATAPDNFATASQQQNSTFANLANQSTLGFGNLAQQSPNASAQSSAFGGGSSFSTWR